MTQVLRIVNVNTKKNTNTQVFRNELDDLIRC